MATIKKIAAELNYELDKRVAYGNHKGYQVTLIQNFSAMNAQDNFKILCVPFSKIDTTKRDTLVRFIAEFKKELRVVKYDINADLITIRLNEGFKGIKAETITSILDLLLEGFAKAGMSPLENCIYCGEEHPDTSTYIDRVKFHAHETCRQDTIKKVEERKATKYEGNGNALMGIIGAILGAIVGAIPWTVGVWFGWFVSPLALITGFASYAGFKILGGEYRPYVKYLVPIVSLITIILSNLVIVMMVAYMNDVSFTFVLQLEDVGDFLVEAMMFSLGFGALGLFYVFRKIKQDGDVAEIK